MALNAIQRLDAEEELMGRLVECINLGHPHRDRMMGVDIRQAMTLSDDRLTAMSERLRVWIEAKHAALAVAAQDGSAIAAPVEAVS